MSKSQHEECINCWVMQFQLSPLGQVISRHRSEVSMSMTQAKNDENNSILWIY